MIKIKDSASSEFGDPTIHIAMLNDRVRTASFLSAIQAVVRPGDVVIDLGSGTGVLALAAARAGASQVYAIEANPRIADIAEANFARNGFADRITLFRGRSTKVKLPERADVLVSEIIGDDPFDEQVIEITMDARRRLLKPNARMIPNRIEVFGLPVTVPPNKHAEFVYSQTSIDRWRSWYDLDFSALAEASNGHDCPIFNICPQDTRKWYRMSEPLRFANIDLHQRRDRPIDFSETVVAQASGLLNGLLIYFELALSQHVRLSTHPDQADDYNHWRSPVWGANPPFAVQAGDLFTVQYEADSRRNWTFASIYQR